MAEQFPSIGPGAIAAPPREGGRASSRSRGRGRSGGSNVAVSTVLAMLCVALAAAGWFIFNQQRELRENNRQLADYAGRIGALEERLRMTDESLSESDAATDDKLSFWETEIRKVWDLANKRNKRWIEENRAAIAQANKAATGVESSVNALKSTVARLDTSAKRQQEVADLVTALDMRLQRVQQAQRDLVDKVNAAAQTASRVRENEEDIAAINASRTTVSRRLTELKDALADLEARVGNLSVSAATP